MLKAFDTFIIIWIDMKSSFQMKFSNKVALVKDNVNWPIKTTAYSNISNFQYKYNV